MPEAFAEETTVVKPRKRWGRKAAAPEPAPAPVDIEESTEPLQVVTDGGKVKRIHFHGAHDYKNVQPARSGTLSAPAATAPASRGWTQPTPRTTTVTETITVSQRRYEPRLSEGLDSIHSELDERLGLAPTGDGVRSRTLYKTDTGAVRSYEGPSGRAITISTRKGETEEERRFSSRLVDPVISNVQLEEETVVRETVTELVPRARLVEIVKPAEEETAAPRRKGFFARRKERKAAKQAEPVSDYQPQCAAITEDGAQCRNSSRGGSKYCSSHKGYRPPTMEQVIAAKDTAPRVENAPDSAPLETGAWEPGNALQAQCSALTADGKQCKNSSRDGSSYCGSHKGYRAPSKATLKEALDTRPRWANAPDTKPAISKSKKGKR